MRQKKIGSAMLGILFCVGSMVLAGETNNLVANGGFEEAGADNSIADGWFSDSPAAARTEEKKHEGKFSMKCEIPADADKWQTVVGSSSAASSFKPGDVVEFSAFVMSTAQLGAGSSAVIALGISDEKWKSIASVTLTLPSKPTNEWTKISDKFTIPAEFKSDWKVNCKIVVWLGGKPEKAGAIYVDDVQAVVLPAAAPAK